MANIDQIRLVYGCMRVNGDGSPSAIKQAHKILDQAVDLGIFSFDHADIYDQGRAETTFGKWLSHNPELRKSLQIYTKCGIRAANTPLPGSPKRYELSAGHIIDSVRRSLERLSCDYLDALILHRFDHLLIGEEIGDVFEDLRSRGLVRHFGVSNFTTHQLTHVQGFWQERLSLHQMEINACNIEALFDGRLMQCMNSDIVVQAWSPLAGIVHQTDRLNKKTAEALMSEIELQARNYDIEPSAVILSWLMRHPAKIWPVIGTTNSERLKQTVMQTQQLIYGREEWYRLYSAIRGIPLE